MNIFTVLLHQMYAGVCASPEILPVVSAPAYLVSWYVISQQEGIIVQGPFLLFFIIFHLIWKYLKMYQQR